MTPHQTLAVAVRLFAILLAFYVGRELLAYVVSSEARGDLWAFVSVAAGAVLALLFVIGLWFFPRTIARGLLPLSSDVPNQPAPPDIWFAMGSSLIGLWLMASAVPGVAHNALFMYLFPSESMDISVLRSGLFYYSIQLGVGVVLLLGAKGLRTIFLWVRNADSS